jgi:hypothetical protein
MFLSGRSNGARTLAGVLLAAVAILLTTIRVASAATAPGAPPPAIEPAAFAAQARFPEPLIATAPTTPAEDQGLAALATGR